MSNDVCSNIEPLAVWIEKPEAEGECKSCALSGLIPEYMDVLGEFKQMNGLNEKIEAALEDTKDPIGALAKVLDDAKQGVTEEVKARLQLADCMAINYKAAEV